MPSVANVLKAEIARVSSKMIRAHIQPIQAAASNQRQQLVGLKKQVRDLERQIQALRRLAGSTPTPPAPESAGIKVRFSAKGLRSMRRRLDLSAEQFGGLVGVSGQTIYSWEGERSEPRRGQVEAIAALRGVGKRQARARLESLASK